MPQNKIKKIDLLIVDDHDMIRDGLKVMLQSLSRHLLFNITEAESGEEAIKKMTQQVFSLVIIDYELPGLDGPEVVECMLRNKPGMKILALSNHDELPYVQRMKKAGVNGYILKTVEPSELLNAIITILSGKSYYCSEITDNQRDAGAERIFCAEEIRRKLSSREIEVLQMICMGMSNDRIAKELSVATRTIYIHRQNLLSKLQVDNLAGMMKIAMKLGLIK